MYVCTVCLHCHPHPHVQSIPNNLSLPLHSLIIAKPHQEIMFWQRKKGSRYKNSGEVMVNRSRIRQVYSFIDYLKGGMELNAFIGIDFTGKLCTLFYWLVPLLLKIFFHLPISLKI